MKAKQRTLLVLLALAALLGAALYAVERSNTAAQQAESAAAEGTISLSSFGAGEVEQIQYTYQGETYTLQYGQEGWTLAEDPAYHLDASACQTMVTALSSLNAKRQITPQQGEDYGFSEPLVTVTVTAAGQTTTLTFGGENPVTGDLYLQKAGEEAVYTVAANKASCFELDKAGLFGSFNPAGITASALEQIRYTLADGTAVSLTAFSEQAAASSDASSEEEDSSSTEYSTVWRLIDEPDTPLDDTKINAILSALGGYVTGQLTHAAPEDYGFDHPLVTVETTTAEGTNRLYFASGTDSCYLMVEGDSSIYPVALDTVQALLYTPDQLKAQ